MPFPSPSLAPPALSLYQWSYGALAFGGIAPGSAYQIQSAVIDMPAVASGDVQRALDQGEFPGLDILPGKDVTIVQVVTTPGLSRSGLPTLAQAVAIDQACQALGAVLGPGGVTEAPLYVQMASGTFVSLARARKHSCPWDVNRAFAGGAIATTLFHCTDPRWYAAPSMSQTVGAPVLSGGLALAGTPTGASIPAVLAGSSGGLVSVVNSGPFESRPILIVTGPCTNPQIANTSIPGNPTIGVAITLNAGDTLLIDTDWQSVVYTTYGSTLGSSRRNALMPGSTWWNLPANSSSAIRFSTSDPVPVGTLTVQSASAYLTL